MVNAAPSALVHSFVTTVNAQSCAALDKPTVLDRVFMLAKTPSIAGNVVTNAKQAMLVAPVDVRIYKAAYKTAGNAETSVQAENFVPLEHANVKRAKTIVAEHVPIYRQLLSIAENAELLALRSIRASKVPAEHLSGC